MLRKTVTTAHGEGSAEAQKAAESGDKAKLAAATASAYGAVDDLEAAQAAADAERAAKAKANSRSGIKTFRGCVC